MEIESKTVVVEALSSMNNSKLEKFTKVLSTFSLFSLIIGVILMFVNMKYSNEAVASISQIGITIFVLPFLWLQIAMPANLTGVDSLKANIPNAMVYIIIFPFVDAWFFTGLNMIFGILYDYDIFMSLEARSIVSPDKFSHGILYICAIYFSLLFIGLAVRLIKNK